MSPGQNPHACGDGACVLLVPGVPRGMGTNAGCRCLAPRSTPEQRARVRSGIRWLASAAAPPLGFHLADEQLAELAVRAVSSDASGVLELGGVRPVAVYVCGVRLAADRPREVLVELRVPRAGPGDKASA